VIEMELKDLDVDRVHKAFSPAREILDPDLFVGRRTEVEDGISALMNRGGFIAIYGLRGVGKSSIAQQLKLIAEGDTTVPKALAMGRMLPKKGFSYIVHYVRSDGFVNNIIDLIKRIIFGDENNPSLFSLTKAGERRLQELKKIITAEGGANLFGAKIGAKGSQEEKYETYVSDDLIQQFRHLLGTVQKDNHQKTGLLILIDEFDTIPNKEGFSSLVKACSSDFIKFGVIGIATNVSELIKDHTSIGRQVDFIHVPLMPRQELSLILRRGEFRVQRLINFDDEADNLITALSEGFPYFTHLLGKESMLLSYQRSSPKVTKMDIEVLSEKIARGRLNTIFESLYHEAVKHSPQREILLKAFAECDDDEINTGPVYNLAQEFGVTNPPQLMKQLTKPDNPDVAPVLVKVRDRYFRFSDPVFKAYARIRNWKFD
jgi:hypothetical protein